MNQIIPPCAPEIEKDVLGVLSNRPELFHMVEEILNAECFYDSDNKFLFEVLFKVHSSGEAVTQSAILHQIIPTGQSHLLPMYQSIRKSFTTEKHLVQNADILAEYSTKRALLIKAYQLLGMIEKNDSIDEIEAEVADANSIVVSRNKSSEPISMSEAVDGMIELMNRDKKDGITGITTGIPILDRITGGWEYDDKVVIAARPGMGKTAVATFHANISARMGYPTAFVSLEVRPSKLAARMTSNESGFSASDITKGNLADNQKRIVIDKSNMSRSLPLYFYDNTRSRDVNDVLRTLRIWHRKFGLKIIYIDYIGLLKDRTVKNQSDRVSLTETVMGKLTEFGDQIGVALIIFSQLNRGSEGKGDKRPALENLKNSGKLEEDATRVIFLFRKDYYDANEAESRGENFIPSHDMEYIFAKNREGELGPVTLKCNVAINRVYEEHSDQHNFYSNGNLNGVSHSF